MGSIISGPGNATSFIFLLFLLLSRQPASRGDGSLPNPEDMEREHSQQQRAIDGPRSSEQQGGQPGGNAHGGMEPHEGGKPSGQSGGSKSDGGSKRSGGGESRGSRSDSRLSKRRDSRHSSEEYLSDEHSHSRKHRGYGQPTCSDESDHCYLRKNLCIVAWAFEEMARLCAHTCNRCHKDLLDVSDRCEEYAHQCHRPEQKDLMAWMCPYTCGYELDNRPRPLGRVFTGDRAGLNCQDKPECVHWVSNGFCASLYYTTAHKREHCPKSCRLCFDDF